MIDLEIKQLAAKYKTGETNPVKVIDHCLSRIEAHEIKLSAFELVMADQAPGCGRDGSESLFIWQSHGTVPRHPVCSQGSCGC